MNAFDLENIQSLAPIEFENLVKSLFIKMGFNATTTKTTGDGGIDIIAINEQPIVGGKYVIQCKRYTTGNNIGEPAIRELFGIMHAENANKGILITTSDFSKQAITFAQDKAIELINGSSLLNLLIRYFPEIAEDVPYNLIPEELSESLETLNDAPTHFRGIEWGTSFESLTDMIIDTEFNNGRMKNCIRVNDIKKMGTAILDSVLYTFYYDRLSGVRIIATGQNNFEALLNYIFPIYGKNYELLDVDFAKSYEWDSNNVIVDLVYYKNSDQAVLDYKYKPLHKEIETEETKYYEKVIKQKQEQKKQCFVATAIYSSTFKDEVMALRHWRDNYLTNYWAGRQFIRIYYKVGPIIAHYIADKYLFKIFLKKILDVFVKLLQKNKCISEAEDVTKFD